MTKQQIKQLRLRLKETQAEFADRFGGRQATVSAWENGKNKPNKMAIKILKQLEGIK